MSTKVCVVDDCGRGGQMRRGMCGMHDTIDDPDAKADLGDDGHQVRPLGRPQPLTLETIEWLLDQEPFTLVQLAHRLDVGRDAIEHFCARQDRRDLLTRMARNSLVREMTA